jgi:Asp-tRNA(Asn)/Glu-tRNA(Gln) amidotransferase A subunit family amidase
MNGYDSTCGLSSRALKPKSDDAVIIRALRDHLLATPLFRSNVNQGSGILDVGCFTSETSNSLWGRALNPYNKDFSTGGSCGGEAGLVATLSSTIGLAIDQFGDARYPASCCGVVAFKPTSNRMSSIGISHPGIRSSLCKPVVSPIARSVKDIIYLLRCLWDSQV